MASRRAVLSGNAMLIAAFSIVFFCSNTSTCVCKENLEWLLSVCRAPYSGLNFSAIFLRHSAPLTSVQKFREIVSGNPSVGGVKRKRGSKIERGWTCRRLYLIRMSRSNFSSPDEFLPMLTLSPPIQLRLFTSPYWSNPPFLTFDIRALWRSGLSARVPECQNLK